jgi:hypothetical protein
MPNSGTLILNNMIGRVIDLPDLAIGQFAMWHTALNSLQWSDPGETMRHPVVCVWYAGRDNASFLPPPSRLGLGLSVFAIARRCLTQVI